MAFKVACQGKTPVAVHDTFADLCHKFSIFDRGDQQHFVRRDELRAAWAIFTPLLHQIDEGKITPELYSYGSRGPDSLEEFLKNAGYIKVERYKWKNYKKDAKL